MRISSENKKILLFSDVHNEVQKVKNIINNESADLILCLGDWYDSFTFNETRDYVDTTNYLLDFVNRKNCYTLFGNHDIQYLFDNKRAICSGYEALRHDSINRILNHTKIDVQNRFKWYFVIDDYLCTHAGLHLINISAKCESNEDIYSYLDKEGENAISALRSQSSHWFYEAGKVRGGRSKRGGILWLDFNDEFEPIENLKQIVGHTNQWETQKINITDPNNICIDCSLKQYIIIQNGKLEIKNYSDI